MTAAQSGSSASVRPRVVIRSVDGGVVMFLQFLPVYAFLLSFSDLD